MPMMMKRDGMSKVITHTKLSDTLALSECMDGFWLYDSTRGMNLSMKAKSRDAAFVKALSYYQDRLLEIEGEFRTLKTLVTSFVDNVGDRYE